MIAQAAAVVFVVTLAVLLERLFVAPHKIDGRLGSVVFLAQWITGLILCVHTLS